jgi:multicomponent Na+:H+ antiporter subunit A
MLTAILLTFLAGAVAPWAARLAGAAVGWWYAAVPLALSVYFASLLPRAASGISQVTPWVPSLGVDLAFRLDGLSLTFALMISIVGVAVVSYAGGYLKDDPLKPRFLLILLSFMAAMLGVVLADDLIALFVFWELTSLTSYFLIGYKHEKEESRYGALQGLIITGSGGLAMLAGFLLLGSEMGTFRISEIVAQGDAVRTSGVYLPAFALIALGAFTKSAQFPFHVWLPNAMAAPTPVSAFLHSATMVKAGVYLLARMQPALGGTDVWFWTLTLVGSATLLATAGLSLVQRDLKKLLAYSTLIALGALVVLLGAGGKVASEAVIVFMLAHALYKAPLFMVAGNVDHEAGTRDVTTLRGLGSVMPLTWTVAILAGISAAGLPPLLGFVGKELAYEALLPATLPLVALIAASVAMIGIVGQVAVRPFRGRTVEAEVEHPHEAPPSMWLGPLLLAVGGVVFGVFPMLLEPLAVPAASAVVGAPLDFYLKLWHGLNLPLALTVLTIMLGLILAFTWSRLQPALESAFGGVRVGPAGVYDAFIKGVPNVSAAVARRVQSDNLRDHLVIIMGFTVGLVGVTAVVRGNLNITAEGFTMPSGTPYEWVVLALAAAGALATVRAHSRLEAITALGVVGFAIALIFTFFAAPDLAITQFLVETLIVILVALVLMRLPDGLLRERTGAAHRLLSGGVAVLSGLLLAGLLIVVTAQPLDLRLTEFFNAASYPDALGKNVVNVILVDFRAFDTLGEIAVLVVASTGVYALLRRVRKPAPTSDQGAPGGPEGGP